MAERHDGGYRLLFSHPRMVEDLVRGFLRSDVSGRVGFMERRSEVYVSDRLERREQGRFPEARIPAILELEEMRPMLRETVLEWTREWEQNGRRQGEARLLTRQLELKFGPLEPEDQARIDGADAERLLAWGERILNAKSLEEVFGVS